MDILTLNCGSSSLKYQLYRWDDKEVLAQGIVERVTVGHRVVHGGERFSKSVIIDDHALATFNELSDLAPLHNPPNITGIEAAREVLLGKDPFATNLVCFHIGNGSSANAVKNGVSVDTSMGFTPLEGLVMGTRAGDHDAAIGYYIMRKEDLRPEAMESILNRKSGVLGITEKYTDRRDIEENARRGDAIVFTAGVGERGPITREKCLGKGSKVGIFVIPYSFQGRDYVNKAREKMLKAEIAVKKGLAEIIARPR